MEDNKWLGKAVDIARLVKEKNVAYGSSFDNAGELLKILYPSGIPTDQYDTALALTRIFDKMFRLANKPDAFGESPWNDIVGYALLGAVKSDEKKAAQPNAYGTLEDTKER